MDEENEYDERANDFLKRNNIKINFRNIGRKLPPWDNGGFPVRTYKVTMTKDNKQKFTSPFYDSIYNTQEHPRNKPIAYDFLACISSTYYYESFEEFCLEYGYDTDSRRAYKTWKLVNKEAEKMEQFFTEEELTELRDIQ